MSFFSAWKESDGSWSWARLASTGTVVAAIYGFIHVVLHSHGIPDAATLTGLSAFGVAPYGVNKTLTAFAKKDAAL